MNIKPHPLNRRRGRFRVTSELVREHPDELMRVLACVLVVRCEADYATESLEYTAISELFAEVEDYCVTPEYECLLQRVNVGTDEEPEYETRLLEFRRFTKTP